MKLSWQNYFIRMAELVASKSKDPHSKNGAIIVGPDMEIRSTGYNGMPRGCNDEIPARLERPEKYFWFAHAERNAIDNAARMGTPLKGCFMVMTKFPCMDCARSIVQVGITQVIAPKLDADSKWLEHAERAVTLFKECGVELRFYTPENKSAETEDLGATATPLVGQR